MIPDSERKDVTGKPPEPQIIYLTPDPVECSEKGCKEIPVIAYWQEGEKFFRFACDIHQYAHSSNGRKVIEVDNIENYNKKRKRKIYQKHFKEYL